ncbi:hypothetical protein [Roseibium aggregatum]|uniref:Uncharacterized protein n=1 Tax=Roseibium aggregatum TaxID=187304 RepID=A0A939EL78_9HYPH|nr:hypothetical protein [Roseibium aggregatum]MBN9673824.1 hypothetical protein [Roseibium aggregatum]
MLYTAYVAVCLASTPVQDCNRNTAHDWMVAPGKVQSLSYCMVRGQQYAATSGIVKEGDIVKVYCKAPDQFRTAG